MNRANACFISYRHTDDRDAHRFVQAFVQQLRKQLKWHLPDAPIFFDEEGIKVGDAFNEMLAYELCRSACLVIFFSPLHFDPLHPYCGLEYKAMVELERTRLSLPGDHLRTRGLIFPIVFRGIDHLPQEILDHRQYERLDHVVSETDFRKQSCQIRIKALADQIFDRYRLLHNLGVFEHDCGQFVLPVKAEVVAWLSTVAPLRYKTPGH